MSDLKDLERLQAEAETRNQEWEAWQAWHLEFTTITGLNINDIECRGFVRLTQEWGETLAVLRIKNGIKPADTLHIAKIAVDAAYWRLQEAIATIEGMAHFTPVPGDESQQQLLDANERKPATIESELDKLEKHEGNGGAV